MCELTLKDAVEQPIRIICTRFFMTGFGELRTMVADTPRNMDHPELIG